MFLRYLLWLRRYERKSVEVGVFRRGWVTLSADFRGKWALPTNHCWCQMPRVIAVSCGIKISAVHHLVLSQHTRLTNRRTDGQNCDSNTARCITCSRTVKIAQQRDNKQRSYKTAHKCQDGTVYPLFLMTALSLSGIEPIRFCTAVNEMTPPRCASDLASIVTTLKYSHMLIMLVEE